MALCFSSSSSSSLYVPRSGFGSGYRYSIKGKQGGGGGGIWLRNLKGVAVPRVKRLIHEKDIKSPVDLHQITLLKDRIERAAVKKSFLIFNGCIDGNIDDESKYETCDDDTMEYEAAHRIARPITVIHQHSFPFIDPPKDNMDNPWNPILFTSRYVSRYFRGYKFEKIFNVLKFNDKADKIHNCSAHILHIRNTGRLTNDDIAYLSKIENPKSLEIRKGINVLDLIDKCKLINPTNAKGALVIIVHPHGDMLMKGFAEMFVSANVEATWVISPLLVYPTRNSKKFYMAPLQECLYNINRWNRDLYDGGIELGGLLLEMQVKDVFIADPAEGYEMFPGSPVDHPGGSLPYAKDFLNEAGLSIKLVESMDD